MNAAYDDPAEDLSAEQRRARRLRFELIFASLGLAFGLFLLPALIYWVGAALLGTYGEKAGLSTFYVDFYADLADGTSRTWLLALGPLALVYLMRGVFIGVRPKRVDVAENDDSPRERPVRQSPAQRPAVRKEAPARNEKGSSARPARVEPRMGSD